MLDANVFITRIRIPQKKRTRIKNVYLVLWFWEIVHGNGEEHVEKDVVAADEQNYKVETKQEPETLKTLIC